MKTKRFSFLAGISLAAALILSCSALKDALDDMTTELSKSFAGLTESNLLQGSKAGFMSGEGIPDGDETVITNLQINGSAVQGGSTSITVTANQPLDSLFLQIEGEDGYYGWKIDPNDPDIEILSTNPIIYQITLRFNTSIGDGEEGTSPTFTVSGRTISGGEVASISKDLPIIKTEGAGSPLQITLSWDNSDDVDLYVWSPGETRPLFFGGPVEVADDDDDGIYKTENGNGYLDIDANANCRTAEVAKKINAENIYFKTLEDGDYNVVIQLYKKCERTGAPGARYNVTANVKGKFVNFGQKSDQFDDSERGALSSIGSYPRSSTSTDIVIGTITIANGVCTSCN